MSSADCRPERRCRRRGCEVCGPIRLRDERRKFLENLKHYGGRTVIVSVTAPGELELPWDESLCTVEGPHKHTGPRGCRVHRPTAYAWCSSSSERYRMLWDAATESADRLLRRNGYRGRMPRRVAAVWAPQTRGVWHVHEALPAATELEKLWSRHVVEYLSRRGRAYGWGYVDRNPLRYAYPGAGSSSHERAASYLARNAAGYLAENASSEGWLPGRRLRSYVSRRLTTASGVTMRSIRDAHYLWAILELGLEEPRWFTDELRLERAWAIVVGLLIPRPPPGAAAVPR